MPARSTRITLHNRTPHTLTLTGSGLDHGDWTPGGWTPPGSIAPGATAGWQSESAGIATGTQGHIDFSIDGSAQNLSIQWDNPFVGLNSYHQQVGPGFGISFSGGKGDNTEAVYTLQTDVPVFVPGFVPSRNGFPFGNSWPSEADTYLELPPFTWWGNGIKIGDASNGLCGGMAFAVRDYFDAGQWPAQNMPSGVGDPVFDYIVRRLFDSFNSPVFGSCAPQVCGGYNLLANVVDFQTQMDPIYPDSDNYVTDGAIGDGRAWIMAHESWPGVQDSIDRGAPCPLGLVMVKSLLPTDLGNNHQVTVYGYQLQQQRLTLHLYDPNSPGRDDISLSLDITDTGEPITVTHNVNAAGPVYSFFPLRYEPMGPVGGFSHNQGDGSGTAGAGSVGAAVSRIPDQLDVFWVGPDGGIGTTWWNAAPGAGWGDHQPFGIAAPGLARPGGPVAAVSRHPGQLDAFWVGPDGAVWTTWWDAAPGAGWGDHAAFPIAPAGAAQGGAGVAAVARGPRHLDVFWIGSDGAVWTNWWDAAPGAGWGDHAPFTIAPAHAASVTSGLAALARTIDHLDVFWVGPDGGIGTTWWDAAPGAGWGDHAPFPIAPSGSADVQSAVTAVARRPDQLDVFWVGPDGGIGTTWWNAAPGANWSDHQPFGIAPAGAAVPCAGVAAVARTPDQLDVFWVGPDGGIGTTWWNAAPGANWGDHAPFPIAPSGAASAASFVAAPARTPDHLDVFWVGPNGGIGTTWWDAAPGAGWGDHQPFGITPAAAATRPSTGTPASTGFAVARTPEHLDVFWTGQDGAVGTTWWYAGPGTNWGDHQPFPITGPNPGVPAGAAVASISREPEQLDVFWVGGDGAVWTTWWDSAPKAGWGDHAPFSISPAGQAAPGAPVTVVARMLTHLDVFWTALDGTVWTNWWDAAPGQGWGDHGAFPIAPAGSARPGAGVAAVARMPGHLDVFWIGPDGGVGTTWWDAAPGQGWGDHAPFAIAPPAAAADDSPLAAVARMPGHLDVFWVGPDGGIGTTWWDAAPGQGWGDHAPFAIAPPAAARAGSDLAALSRTPDQLDVFWIGPDGGIGTTWWNAAPGASWGDHQPFPITPPGAV